MPQHPELPRIRQIARHAAPRVIEAGESGIATPETANLEDYRREIQRLKSDNDAKELQVARLSEQLEQKAAELNSLTERVTGAEQRLKTRIASL